MVGLVPYQQMLNEPAPMVVAIAAADGVGRQPCAAMTR